MSVAAWRSRAKPKTWSHTTYWCGHFGTFEAVKHVGSWRWKGGYQLVGICVDTEDDGSHGIPLMQWIAPDTYKIHHEGDVAADVWIKYSRDWRTDFRRARDAMRKKLNAPDWDAPSCYTWHHHEQTGRMQLIPSDPNSGIGHTGGIPHYRMNTGDY